MSEANNGNERDSVGGVPGGIWAKPDDRGDGRHRRDGEHSVRREREADAIEQVNRDDDTGEGDEE